MELGQVAQAAWQVQADITNVVFEIRIALLELIGSVEVPTFRDLTANHALEGMLAHSRGEIKGTIGPANYGQPGDIAGEIHGKTHGYHPCHGLPWKEDIAKEAYEIADAMLEERKKNGINK